MACDSTKAKIYFALEWVSPAAPSGDLDVRLARPGVRREICATLDRQAVRERSGCG